MDNLIRLFMQRIQKLSSNEDPSGVHADSKDSSNVVADWLHGLSQMCKTPVFIPTGKNRVLLRTCRACGSSVDRDSEDCPLCGDSKSDIFAPNSSLRFQGICSACQTCCYEPCFPVCGDKIEHEKESRFSYEREPMTWTVTALRVRTPTGAAGAFFFLNFALMADPGH